MTLLEAPPRQYTPEDLLEMPDGERYELVDGSLVETHTGWKSSWVAGQITILIGVFCRERGLGWVTGSEASYQCFPDAPKKVRRPDASFVRLDRLPAGHEPEGHCRIAPDLAVEVVSPNDVYSAVEEKVAEYLGAGVPLVWVVNPPLRSACVHRLNGSVTDVPPAGALDGEDVLPGFRCPLADVFRTPGGATLTAAGQ